MLKEFGKRLLKITEDCGDDMHEPENQGVTATITGFDLDNATGDSPYSGEFVVGLNLVNTVNNFSETEWFNLASLIALARIGAKQIVNEFND